MEKHLPLDTQHRGPLHTAPTVPQILTADSEISAWSARRLPSLRDPESFLRVVQGHTLPLPQRTPAQQVILQLEALALTTVQPPLSDL